MLDRVRHTFLGWWSRLISRRPGWVLFVACAAAVASISVAYSQLHFESDRNALIEEALPWNQRYLAWQDQFPDSSGMVVAVDTHNAAGEPDEAQARRAEALVDTLGQRLQTSDAVIRARWGYDPSQSHGRAMRLRPMVRFEASLAQLERAGPLLESETPSDLILQAQQAMQSMQAGDASAANDAAADPAAGIDQFRRLIDAFTRRMATPADQPINLAQQAGDADAGANPWQYLRSENDRLLFINITPRLDPESLSPYQQAIGDVRTVLDDVRSEYPDVEFGLTGIGVIEADETAAATADSTIASIVAVILIALIIITAFHSFRVPLMLLTALIIGIAWTFGFLTLAIGHLQIISVVFVVLLLGLGIAFGIHLASGFELVRHGFPDTQAGFRDALQQTLETIGPGLLTGAVTTAAAFATTIFTDFRGVAEMGVIAGAGVILCLVAMCSVYPALLRLVKPHHRHFKPMTSRRVHLFEERWVMPFVRHPKWTLAAAGLLVVASGVAITQLRFDYNLMALMPRGVESVQWQRRIVEQGEQSVWAATSIANSMDEARALTGRFRDQPTVESVGGIAQLFPQQADEREQMVADARGRLSDEAKRALANIESDAATQPAASEGQQLVDRIGGLRLALWYGSDRVPDALAPKMNELQQSLGAFTQTAETLPPEVREARLDALQRDYAHWRERVAEALSPGQVQPDDLPGGVIDRFIGETREGSKRYALQVYPNLPAAVDDPLDPRFLADFVEDVYAVDPQATGSVVQVYESGTLIWRSYMWAGVYALLAVFMIVAFDFQSFRDAALALIPVAVGFAITFGVMYLANVQINPANIIVLPLMFGIGVDAGVHILHRYRQAPYRQPPGLTAGTGKGITLTSIATMIGFGALMLASHRGIASLGFVLTVGIGLTMLACWTIMPAWLELRNQHRMRRQHRKPAVTQEPAAQQVKAG